jgi:uncharacterized GH25 family protein
MATTAMQRSGLFAALSVTLVTLGAATLDAHDFWIEPRTFRTEAGALIGLHLLVGERLLGDPIARDAASIDRFVVARRGGEQPVPGREGGDPAGVLRVDGAGLMVVAYHSRPHVIDLTRETFDKYLGEEGLDAVKAMLGPARQRAASAREQYSRCAKALLSSGPPSAADRDRALGMPLELVAERNPYTTAAGQEFPVALLYRGAPLADALIIAINKDDPSSKLTARSDRQGRVVFHLPRAGTWLIKAVHMIPGPRGSKVDWESFWASLTFDLPAEGRPGPR